MLATKPRSRQARLAERSPRCAPAPLYKIPPVAAGLTERQERVLLAIQDFSITHRRGPTVREVGAILGLSCNAVDGVLRKLLRKGRVESRLTSQPWLPAGYSALPEPTAKSKARRR